MSINGEIVRHVGRNERSFTYQDCRLERKGFLSVLSFQIAGIGHHHDLMERGRAAVVMPADFRRRELYLIEQPRFLKAFSETEDGRKMLAAARSGGKGEEFTLDAGTVMQLEFPAGVIDGEETPAEAASRELREETGIVVPPSDLVEVATYYPSLGGSTEQLTAFIARLPERLEVVETDGDGAEQITVWKMSFDEAFRQMRPGGRIGTASSHILLRELRIMDLQNR